MLKEPTASHPQHPPSHSPSPNPPPGSFHSGRLLPSMRRFSRITSRHLRPLHHVPHPAYLPHPYPQPYRPCGPRWDLHGGTGGGQWGCGPADGYLGGSCHVASGWDGSTSASSDHDWGCGAAILCGGRDAGWRRGDGRGRIDHCAVGCIPEA